MQLNKQIFKVITTVSLALPSLAAAQNLTSSINTFSPYSMYGLGELATPGTTSMRSMGGVGVAMRSTNKVNVLNPAAYSQTPQKSFLFEFGVEAGHFRNSQTKYGTPQTTARTAYNSINFHEIAFQMPLAKGLGFGFSLTPYSNVGYNMHSDELSSGVAGNLGRAQYQYYGDGDVTEAKAGIGWSPFKNFSIGAAMQYYWGNITRNYKAVPTDIITGSGEYSTTTGIDTYDVSRIKAQFGVQWNAILNARRALTFGATYDIGGLLGPKSLKYVYIDNLLTSTVRNEEDTSLPLRLPRQIAAGVFYQTVSLRMGVDYVYQNWGDENSNFLESDGAGKGVTVAYHNTNTVRVGLEVTPKPIDTRNYLNRVAYRIGFRYGDYYQTFGGSVVRQMAVTAGIGLPVKLFGRSSVEVGFEFGMRDPVKDKITLNDNIVGLVKNTYYKFSIGVSLFGEDDWFRRYKFK